MKKWSSLLSLICIFALLCSSAGTASAAESAADDVWSTSYNSDINNVKYVTAVKNQQSEDDCVVYALLAAAESYCIKNNGASANKLNFNEQAMRSNIKNYINFGEVLYSSVNYSLGSGCYITGIENLTDRGEMYLKHEIVQNGAVVAAISLPEGGMTDENYYSSENASFYCGENTSEKNHAFEIVGWDDSFSRKSFVSAPKSSGAWLCKNSYGEGYGSGGYFWLSYKTDFLYTASVDVSTLSAVSSVKTISSPSYGLGYVSAVGFRSIRNIDNAEIEILKAGNVIEKITIDVVNGYNFLPLSVHRWYCDIDIMVNGCKVSEAATSEYITLIKSVNLKNSAPEDDEWLKTVDSVTVDLTGGTPLAYSMTEDSYGDAVKISHGIVCSSVYNTWYVTPQDGYRFSEETELWLSAAQAESSDNIEENDITLGSSEYAKLGTDGRISIKSRTTGSAYVTGIDILTDEKGEVSGVALMFDYGQTEMLMADEYTVAKSDESGTSYTAEISVNGYYLQNAAAYVDSMPAEGEITAAGNEFSLRVTINIPKIEETILSSFFSVFASIFDVFLAIFK